MKLRGMYIYQVYDKAEYKYFLYDEGYCLGAMVENFDWLQLDYDTVCEFNGVKYTISKIFDDEENEEQEGIVYVLKPILTNILIGLK